MAANGLLQYYFFPTDFLYPRRQHRVPPLLQPPKTEPVSDRNQPLPSEASYALVLRDLHGNNNNNVPRRRNESTGPTGTKNRSGGGCGEESYGDGNWEAELT